MIDGGRASARVSFGGPMIQKVASLQSKCSIGSSASIEDLSSLRGRAQLRRTTADHALVLDRRDRRFRRLTELKRSDHWGSTRHAVADFFNVYIVKACVDIVIIFNMALLWIETDFKPNGKQVPDWIKLSSFILLLLYILELLLKLYAYRCVFFNHSMNRMDFGLVCADVVAFLFENDIGAFPMQLTILRAVRSLRLVRVIREVLILRELYLMMSGLLSAVRAIAFGTSMIFVVLSMWSILAVSIIHPLNVELWENEMLGECWHCRDAFSSVMRSNLTLASTIIAGDSWGQIAIPLLTRYPATAFVLLPAFISVQLGLVNVIAAVIVDRQTQARTDDEGLIHAEHEEELKRSYERLQGIFKKMDIDNDGNLSWDELMDSYDENGEFQLMMQTMDINREDMPTVFAIMDPDRSGRVDYNEFVERLHYIRHINQRTLQVFVKQTIADMRIEQVELRRLLEESVISHMRDWKKEMEKAIHKVSLRTSSANSTHNAMQTYTSRMSVEPSTTSNRSSPCGKGSPIIFERQHSNDHIYLASSIAHSDDDTFEVCWSAGHDEQFPSTSMLAKGSIAEAGSRESDAAVKGDCSDEDSTNALVSVYPSATHPCKSGTCSAGPFSKLREASKVPALSHGDPLDRHRQMTPRYKIDE